ncbi:MAG: CCA tRNA nucleotidyltransferase [archaeon]
MSEKLNEIFEKVLSKIKPSKQDFAKGEKIAEEIIGKIKDLGYEAVLVGSFPRRTCLKGSIDLDVFVFVPEKEDLEVILEVSQRLFGKKKVKIHYAEHPYVRMKYKGFDVEIVPARKIMFGQEIQTAVDRSPLHHQFLLEKIKGKEDDVLLLKQFLISCGSYGAEEKVKGFSGYLCELLVVTYGSFMQVLEELANLKTHLKIQDPVDPKRNVAAALSQEKLGLAIIRAREFLRNPSINFFTIKKEKRKWYNVLFKFPVPKVIEETAWSQLAALRNNIRRVLEEEGFTVERSDYWIDKDANIALYVSSPVLSKYKKSMGPPYFDYENSSRFIEKHKNCWIEGQRLYSFTKRKFCNVKDIWKFVPKPSHYKKLKKVIVFRK